MHTTGQVSIVWTASVRRVTVWNWALFSTENNNLALLVPFALMGVALVLLLFVCKLTVATGTLRGLVFYANTVGDNRTIFLYTSEIYR